MSPAIANCRVKLTMQRDDLLSKTLAIQKLKVFTRRKKKTKSSVQVLLSRTIYFALNLC